MRLRYFLIAGALMVPALAQAEPARSPKGTMQNTPTYVGTGHDAPIHNKVLPQSIPTSEAIVPGGEIASGQQLKRSSVTGKILANDEHTLILQDGQGQEKFDVRSLAFQRSLKSGDEVTIQMKNDGQNPSAIYLVGASASMGPVASEPAL